MAQLNQQDIARICQDTVGVVLEFVKYNVVADEEKATAEEAEAVAWCIAGTIGLLESYLKVSLPEPYLHNVRAFLDAFSSRVGARIAAVDQKIVVDNPPPEGTIPS